MKALEFFEDNFSNRHKTRPNGFEHYRDCLRLLLLCCCCGCCGARQRDQYYKNILMPYFWHKMSLGSSTNLFHQDDKNQVVRGRCKYVHTNTNWDLEIMLKNIALILRQLYYVKISFTALLVPLLRFMANVVAVVTVLLFLLF